MAVSLEWLNYIRTVKQFYNKSFSFSVRVAAKSSTAVLSLLGLKNVSKASKTLVNCCCDHLQKTHKL